MAQNISCIMLLPGRGYIYYAIDRDIELPTAFHLK